MLLSPDIRLSFNDLKGANYHVREQHSKNVLFEGEIF